MRILVVEDNRVAAHFLAKTLEKLGHTAVAVENGLDAWRLLQSQTFDVVISDWDMPQMDGLTLCQNIRDEISHTYIYFILLTAKDQREDKLAGLQAGADDFLIKPLDPVELKARLEVGGRILGMQTQLANAVVSLNAAQKRFSELFMGLPLAGITIDSHGRIQEWNRACETMFGFRSSDVFEKPLLETICPTALHSEVNRHIEELLKGKPIQDCEWNYEQPDGTMRHMLWNAIPLENVEGQITGAINTMIDITRLKRTERQVRQYSAELERQQAELQKVNELLQMQATTDGLTGLNNHRAFQERFMHEFARAQRYNFPLSLVLIDVDFFKQYNDTFGHPAGDKVLQTVATLLRQDARETDYVARYGGEEFVAILPGASLQEAQTVAERFRKSVADYAWPRRAVTISLGVSTLHSSTPAPFALLEETDNALYQSKQNGRNRVTCFQEAASLAA